MFDYNKHSFSRPVLFFLLLSLEKTQNKEAKEINPGFCLYTNQQLFSEDVLETLLFWWGGDATLEEKRIQHTGWLQLLGLGIFSWPRMMLKSQT